MICRKGKAVAAAVLASYALMLSAMAQEAGAGNMVDLDSIEKQMEELDKQKRELLNNKAAAIAAREKQLEEERKAFEEQKAKNKLREEQEQKLRNAGLPAEMLSQGSASSAPT